METKTAAPRDILNDWRGTIFAYCLPIAAILASGSMNIASGWRTAVWSSACLAMGGACLLNANRCGRVHCWFTGPFFLAMAVVIVLFGTGLLPLGSNGWNMIGFALLFGGVTLTYGPELILGQYRGAP